MAYVYEVNGHRVEFDKEPTEADIDEAARQLGPAPSLTASAEVPKTQLRQEVEALGMIAAVPAAQAIQYAVENPFKTAAGAATVASYIPGVNRLPVIRDVKAIRQGILEKLRPSAPATPAPAPAVPTPPPAPATSPILDAQGRPMVNPARAATAEAELASNVRNAAAQRVSNLGTAGKIASTGGKIIGKALPGVGTAINAVDTYNRFNEGDYLGAGLSAVGTVASPFPVIGTAIGLGTAGINATRDYNKYLEAKRKMEEEQKKRAGK